VPELLTRGDAERLLRFVAEAESLGGNEPFTGELLEQLGHLVHADWVTYNELDRVRKRNLLLVGRPGDEDEGDDPGPIFWDFVIEAHPVCLQHQLGHTGALKLSDFLTPRELRRTRLLRRLVPPVRHRARAQRPDPVAPLAHEDVPVRPRPG
jgi:hypothetical protein